VNSNRVTLLGVLVAVALTVAFGLDSLGWAARVIAGVLVFVGLSIALHATFSSDRATQEVMRFAHWVLGRRA
jgi:uncharacterized ion transporter superfamily protein YfcC